MSAVMSVIGTVGGTWRRRVLAFVVAATASASVAQAAAPFVVADVDSGRVLMSEDATMPWHPASVTKLMTTYVALKQLRAGAIGLETPIPVSRRAASVPPSKIGVKPGQEVTLDNALKMLLVKSANDMAVVIAEGVGGSVETFADMMNREAAALGMRESRFINPNGLFAEGQQTSARDMAILARALLREFPDQADLFNIGAVQIGPRILKNTNGLVGRYPGVMGMKTGFICASGFNLVAVAGRNGQRLVAVVMGANSGADRTIRAAQLLDRGFASGGGFFGSGSGQSLESLPPSGIAAAPNMREDICVRRKGAPASEEEAETAVHLPVPGAGNGEDTRYATLGAGAVGFASSVRGSGPRSLGPRAEFQPLPVFVGRSPGSASAPVAANATATPATAVAANAEAKKLNATAYAGEKPTIDPTAGPIAASAGPTNIIPLRAGKAAAIGAGAKAREGVRLGAIQARAPAPKPAAVATEAAQTKPAAAKAKPVAAKAKAKSGKAKPATAKVAPAAKPDGAKSEKKAAAKTTAEAAAAKPKTP